VILFSSAYWKGLLDWLQSYTLAQGYISTRDLELLRVCDTPKEVAGIVQSWYRKQEIVGKKALGEWLLNVF
jgi:predicted Rossmann-fold nucleotide-binding protein